MTGQLGHLGAACDLLSTDALSNVEGVVGETHVSSNFKAKSTALGGG